jgi:2-polyprenyl-6-methoxyphenol hydroxylase-like FAD-dependent oxidoreductase
MAGLFAARVLSDSFDQVTVFDRDLLTGEVGEAGEATPRRGVPQGRHVHGFQARGVQILDELFPGLSAELLSHGAGRIEDLRDLYFVVAGHRLSQRPQPIAPLIVATRPFLEQRLRSRVEQIPGVTIRDRVTVTELLATPADGRRDAVVRGVRVAPLDGGPEQTVSADLVVDATGRGSRAPVWLEQLGYQRPADDRIAVRVKYASQTLRLPSGQLPRFAIDGRTATRATGVALFGCERDTWVFTVMGSEESFPLVPTREWMLETAAGLLPDWAADVARDAEPVGPVYVQQHPTSIRRRYDRMRRFPERFVVVGDAVCAFNPVYGQGMSVAAEHALALGAAVQQGLDGAARRYLRAAAAQTGNAWELTAGSDLSYPEVEGNPTRAMRVAGRYVERVLAAAQHDPEVARRFMAVSGLIAPRTSLFHPRVLRPLLRTALRRPAGIDALPGVAPSPEREPALASETA